MSLLASLVSVALVAFFGSQVAKGQPPILHSPGTPCTALGTFANINDCNGYLHCTADRVALGLTPVQMKCSAGRLFEATLRQCLPIGSVHCYSRPRTDLLTHSVIHTILPTTYQAVGTHVVRQVVPSGANVALARLNGPVLMADQCTRLSHQMTTTLRNLINELSPTCAADSVCQSNLPVFRSDCVTPTGRIVV